ncbi:MAG: ligase-associated DNA damage response endonuclease PdeM [Bacteroidota bacterium]
MKTLDLTLAGESVHALADRALFWPARKTLFIADLHIGKAASFRAAGSALPRGTTAHDLARLDRCIHTTGAERLVVLGDFYHHRSGQALATMNELSAWRERHPELRIEVVQGNHDRRSDPSPPVLRVHEMSEGAVDLPFVLAHQPVPSPNGYVLAGHIHPGARFTNGVEEMKLPCFHIGRHVAVLPAFASFSGTSAVTPVQGDRVIAIADEELIETGV